MKPQIEQLLIMVIAIAMGVAAGQSESVFRSLIAYYAVMMFYKMSREG